MDEKYYAVQFNNALIEIRERKMEISPEDEVLAALYIMQEMAKDRRMGEITDEREERQEQQATRGPTEKQKAFIAKYCRVADFKGTFQEASDIVEAKMREKGWGKYAK